MALPLTPAPVLYTQPLNRASTYFGAKLPLRSAKIQRGTRSSVAPAALFGKGGGTTTKSKQAYICLDCGWIYDEGDFSTVPSTFRCPVCRAPKRRFGPYSQPVARNANDLNVRKARKAQLQGGGNADAGLDESDGKNIGVAVAAGVAILGALYFVLNSQY